MVTTAQVREERVGVVYVQKTQSRSAQEVGCVPDPEQEVQTPVGSHVPPRRSLSF